MMDPSPTARRRALRLGGALVAATAAAAHFLRPAAVAAAEEAAVTIDSFAFAPPALTVAAGTRVVWTNRDDTPHTVVGAEDPRALRSPPLDTDDRFAFTFAAPGTYRYFCSLHPHMQGTVVVR